MSLHRSLWEFPVFQVLVSRVVLFHGEPYLAVLFMLNAHQCVGDLVAQLCTQVSAHLRFVVVAWAGIHVQSVPDTNLFLLRDAHKFQHQAATGLRCR